MSLVLPPFQARGGNRVTWQTRWWSSYVFAYKPRLWCGLVSLSHTLEHTRSHTHNAQNSAFEFLFGFETLVFATSGILSMHNQLVTLQRERKTWNRIIWPLKIYSYLALPLVKRRWPIQASSPLKEHTEVCTPIPAHRQVKQLSKYWASWSWNLGIM